MTTETAFDSLSVKNVQPGDEICYSGPYDTGYTVGIVTKVTATQVEFQMGRAIYRSNKRGKVFGVSGTIVPMTPQRKAEIARKALSSEVFSLGQKVEMQCRDTRRHSTEQLEKAKALMEEALSFLTNPT